MTHATPAGPRARSRALAALGAAFALGVSACGGGEEPGSDAESPAGIVPTETPLYLEVAVRPDDDAAEAIDRLYEAATGESQSAGAAVAEAFDASAAEENEDFTYAEDVDPWLGERVALSFGDALSLIEDDLVSSPTEEPVSCTVPEGSIGSISPYDESCTGTPTQTETTGTTVEDFSIIAETTDADAAADSLERIAASGADSESSELEQRSYEGVGYSSYDSGGVTVAVGMIGDYAVLADQAGFESAVDASVGESLAERPEFAESLAGLSEDPELAGFVDTPAFLEAADEAGAIAPEDQVAIDFYRSYLEQPIAFTGEIDSEAVDFALSTGSTGVAAAQQGLLDEQPADAIAAFGIPDLGGYVSSILDLVRDQPGVGAQLEQGSAMFEQQLGISLDEAIAAFGDLSGFVRGESLADLDGAVTIEISDSEIAEKVSEALAEATATGGPVAPVDGLPGAPQAEGAVTLTPEAPEPIYFLTGEQGLTIAYGKQAAAEAVEPSETLAEDATYSGALDGLDGLPPSLYLEARPIAKLIATAPGPSDEVDQAITDVIGELDYLVVGATTEGERDVTRYRIGLRSGE